MSAPQRDGAERRTGLSHKAWGIGISFTQCSLMHRPRYIERGLSAVGREQLVSSRKLVSHSQILDFPQEEEKRTSLLSCARLRLT